MTITYDTITEGDRRVMKFYPYRYQLPRFGMFDDAIEFVKNNFEQDSYTWVGPKFFFKHEHDAMLFILRWS
jgi:hypothetical protein